MSGSVGPDRVLGAVVFKGTHDEIMERLLEGLKGHLEALWMRYLVLREHTGEPDAEEALMDLSLDIGQCFEDAKLCGGFGNYPLAKHIAEKWDIKLE